jgi:hypothetical protein
MADNLSAPSSNPSDRRPHQNGTAGGFKRGAAVSQPIEWLIDTGAQVSCITKREASNFTLTPTGASASATTGGAGILMKTGLTTEFEIIDLTGSPKTVSSALDIGVKRNNKGSEILGMDRLRDVKAAVTWEPGGITGRLYEV